MIAEYPADESIVAQLKPFVICPCALITIVDFILIDVTSYLALASMLLFESQNCCGNGHSHHLSVVTYVTAGTLLSEIKASNTKNRS